MQKAEAWTGAALTTAAERGDVLDLSERSATERSVDLALLVRLCVDPDIAVHARGVRIVGAVFNDGLDLEQANVLRALHMQSCRIRGDVKLAHATTRRVAMIDCEVDGFVDVAGAAISGPLDLTGTVIKGTYEGASLFAPSLAVTHRLWLRNGFRAAGTVMLPGVRIGAGLNMIGATIEGCDTDGHSLVAFAAHIDDDARLSHIRSAGSLRLPGTDVGGALRLDDAIVCHADTAGRAIDLAGASTGGDLSIERAELEGTIVLTGATIGADLELRRTRIVGRGSHDAALDAENIRVQGNAALAENFRGDGTVCFLGGTIGGQLQLAGGSSRRLVLTHAHCASLADDPASWPATGELSLDGFSYDRLATVPSWPDRLNWIRRHTRNHWEPGPYEHLAAIYRGVGDDDAARRIQIAKHDDHLDALKGTDGLRSLPLRAWRRPWGWLVGYGYRRHRAGWLLASTVIAAGLTFHLAEQDDAMGRFAFQRGGCRGWSSHSRRSSEGPACGRGGHAHLRTTAAGHRRTVVRSRCRQVPSSLSQVPPATNL